jgi:PEP-CTERM motif-containing protein
MPQTFPLPPDHSGGTYARRVEGASYLQHKFCIAGAAVVRCKIGDITVKTISSGMYVARQAVMLALLMLALSSRANAASIIFDMCTEASVCNALNFATQLQPGGEITSWLGGSSLRVVEFGINYSSDVTSRFLHGPLLPPFTPLGAGEIGPYGLFTARWQPPDELAPGYNILLEFRDPDGRLPDDLAPFFENSQGIFMASEVRNVRTGATGFVAARLINVTPVPEPGTMLLCASGLVVIARRVRRVVAPIPKFVDSNSSRGLTEDRAFHLFHS